MPVGVPKIPYDIPDDEDEEATWVDLYDRLYRERALFLFKDLSPETANHIVGLMIFLNIDDCNQEQFLFINSTGGGVMHGLAVYNAINFVLPDVHTLCLGVAASMAAFVLAGGSQTKRIAFPNARVMIHQPTSTFIQGYMEEVLMDTDLVLKLREEITNVFVQRSHKPFWMVFEDMERDVFLSPEEAKAYGIVDSVGFQGLQELQRREEAK
uniref:ATP-dependent Clp protease proteolytic subunit n=1 Tax=Pratia nummularia TaxID=368691 RepID=A0A1Z2R185_9ASTR|nr:ATP-dependent protease proteolytic subunit [Pratia nummularia]ASA37416.1 ATP-dependent protease proteolytic subunit [Pratia nummularia]WGH11243.1 ATP-dependent protease proteolytic subunit [Pratia nummularia]